MNWLPISLVVAHFTGDWFLQTHEMAQKKSKYLFVLFDHIFFVGSSLILLVGPFFQQNIQGFLKAWLIYLILHGIQDWNIWKFYAKKFSHIKDHGNNPWFYKFIAVDQLIHLTLLMTFFNKNRFIYRVF